MLLVNLLLALAWTALTGRFGAVDFAFGFGLGFVILYVARGQFEGGDRYVRKTWQALRFPGYVLWELVLANMKVTRTVLFTPTRALRPGIVGVRLDLQRDEEIAMLANLITLTPGTLSLDVSDDRTVLYVHAIEVDDPEAFRRETKDGFERAVREVWQ